jgi:hypothetical protein
MMDMRLQANLPTLTRNTAINVTTHIFQRYCCSKLWYKEVSEGLAVNSGNNNYKGICDIDHGSLPFHSNRIAKKKVRKNHNLFIFLYIQYLSCFSFSYSVCDLIFRRPLLIESTKGMWISSAWIVFTTIPTISFN